MAFLRFFATMVHYIDLFLNVYQTCIPDKDHTCKWYIILFTYCCIQFAKILFLVFASVWMKDISMQFYLFNFYLNNVIYFGIRVMLSSWNELEVFLPLIFWKKVDEIDNYFYFRRL